MKFEDIKNGQKFSTMAGQYIKTGPSSFRGFLIGKFVQSNIPMDGELIPCESQTYLENVALEHCSELQKIFSDNYLSIDSKAHGLKTYCTEVGVVVSITSAMAYCCMRGIEDKLEAKEKDRKSVV